MHAKLERLLSKSLTTLEVMAYYLVVHLVNNMICDVGVVRVKASASRAADRRFDSRFLRGDISGWSHTTDLKIGTPVATLPGAWRYFRVESYH